MTATYDLIASNVLTSSAASVTFSSIPATYRDLVLVMNVTSTYALTTMRFNSDTGSNYTAVRMAGDGSSASSGTQSTTFIDCYIEASTGNRSMSIVQINDYSATDKHKPVLIRATSPHARTVAIAARWANTSAINSITLNAFDTYQYEAGSSFHLYGIVA